MNELPKGNFLRKLSGLENLRANQQYLDTMLIHFPKSHAAKEAQAAVHKAELAVAARIGFAVLALGVLIAVATK